MALTMPPSLAVHPGDWLKSEVVEPHGVSINRLAASFHVSRQALSNLFNGRAACLPRWPSVSRRPSALRPIL